MPPLATRLTGLALAAFAFWMYSWVGPDQTSTDAYLPLANAWLHGHADLDASVYTWIELARYHGQWFSPFPPTATLVVLPFVAIFGQTFDTGLTSAIAGAVGVWLVWGLALQLGLKWRTALFLTLTWAFGSEVFWASSVGGTHLFAETLGATLLLAVLRLGVARRAPVLAGAALRLGPGPPAAPPVAPPPLPRPVARV